jgi:hypothetical protein
LKRIIKSSVKLTAIIGKEPRQLFYVWSTELRPFLSQTFKPVIKGLSAIRGFFFKNRSGFLMPFYFGTDFSLKKNKSFKYRAEIHKL